MPETTGVIRERRRLSAEACAVLDSLPPHDERPALPAIDDLSGWHALQEQIEQQTAPQCERTIDQFHPIISKRAFAGMNALAIRPENAAAGKTPVVYIHGGGYIGFSACSSLFAVVPLAHALQRTIISLDYELAPFSRFDATVPATVSALKTIIGDYGAVQVIGESAGGGLAAAAVRRLAETSQQCPASLVLISPWTDLAQRGDSRQTLAAHDQILFYESKLERCAEAYASGRLDDPDASPVLADYPAGFPRTLIQCGTCEILLSDSVRLYRKFREHKIAATLDLYDGLFHSFQIVAPLSPEAAQAHAEIRAFIDTP